jgi:hypothetical protein
VRHRGRDATWPAGSECHVRRYRRFGVVLKWARRGRVVALSWYCSGLDRRLRLMQSAQSAIYGWLKAIKYRVNELAGTGRRCRRQKNASAGRGGCARYLGGVADSDGCPTRAQSPTGNVTATVCPGRRLHHHRSQHVRLCAGVIQHLRRARDHDSRYDKPLVQTARPEARSSPLAAARPERCDVTLASTLTVGPQGVHP